MQTPFSILCVTFNDPIGFQLVTIVMNETMNHFQRIRLPIDFHFIPKFKMMQRKMERNDPVYLSVIKLCFVNLSFAFFFFERIINNISANWAYFVHYYVWFAVSSIRFEMKLCVVGCLWNQGKIDHCKTVCDIRIYCFRDGI